jgi:hypothetical protein
MEETQAQSFVVLAEGTIASDYALKNLNKALGTAQNEFSPAVKGEENKYVGYKYVPLENLIAATRPSLTKYHLTVSQFSIPDLETKTIAVFTRLVHWDSGEWMQNMMEFPAELALGKDGTPKFNQQTIGGSQTYAQKYAYKAILGIPDSEEMIDSTEEKGDLPARSKAAKGTVQERPAEAAVTIRSQFFSKAKECGWGLGDIKKFIVRAYPDARGSTANLTEDQLQQSLKVMAENKPEDILKTEEVDA